MSRALSILRTSSTLPSYKVGGADKVRFALVRQNTKPFPKRFDFRTFSSSSLDPKVPPAKVFDKGSLKPIPKFDSPVLNFMFGLLGSKPLSKHQMGRKYALDFLEENFKATTPKDLKVGDIIGRTLRVFVDALPVGKNMLSGNIGEHYAHEAKALLQQKATTHALAMVALVETNHWKHTEHLP